jgi:integrase
MARTVRNSKLDSRSARSRLSASKTVHWVAIDRGKAVGYRKGAKGGVWIAKLVRAEARKEIALGGADDVLEANGETILTYSQEQERARAWFLQMEAGERHSPAPVITVAEAVRRYISYLKAEAKTAKDAEQRLNKHVIPTLGSHPVVALTLTDLEHWRNGLVRHDEDDPDTERRSKDTANRLLNYLKAALNRLMLDPKNGITEDRAWRFLKPFEAVGQARQTHLDAAQVTLFLNVTAGAFRRLVTGALLTGCRAGELKAMRVSDFHRETSTLHVSDGKTGRRDVVLTSEGVRFFDGISAGRRPDELLFVRDDGAVWGTHDHHRPMTAAVSAAKLPEDTVFYSLRHTYASQCLMAGMNVQLLAENMGTSVTMIERHYGKFTKLARQQQIEAGVPKLNLQPSNVTPLDELSS